MHSISSRTREQPPSQEDSKTPSQKWPTVALTLVLVQALGYWLWFGLARRTIDNGDGISILAVQGILEHGFQRLPSGYVYTRGYLSHYLVAGSAALFGLNDFSTMLSSLLLGLGSIFLVYRIACDILRRPWIGVAAGSLLVALSLQAWYATSPRMYMPLQFFTLLSTYSVWRGFVQGQVRFKFIALLAITAGTLSNREGAIVALGLSIVTLLVLWLRKAPWNQILSVQNVASALIIGLSSLFLVTYSPPDAVELVIGHAGVDPTRVGLNLDPVNWGRHVLHLERSIPYSLAFAFIAYLALFISLKRGSDPEHRWTFLFLTLTMFFLIFGSIIRSGGHRLILFLIPLYALMVCGGLSAVFGFFSREVDTWLKIDRSARLPFMILLILGFTMSVTLSTLKQVSFNEVRRGQESLSQFLSEVREHGLALNVLLRDGYGLPCGYRWRCDKSLKEQFRDLKTSVKPEDLVVSILPMETNYFLGRMDGWLFFRREGREYPMLEESPTDEYFGVRIIDTASEVRELGTLEQRVWIIAARNRDEPGLDALRDAMWDALEDAFVMYKDGPHFATYRSRAAEKPSATISEVER